MLLSKEQFLDFMSANLKFLYYCGIHTGLLDPKISLEDFQRMDMTTKSEMRDKTLENPQLISYYLDDNSEYLSGREIEIIDNLRYRITSEFIFYKCLPDYAIFYQIITRAFYAVKGLSSRFDELVPDYPKIVQASILPFDDIFVIDGFLVPISEKIEGQIRRELDELYEDAIAEDRIIHNLDF